MKHTKGIPMYCRFCGNNLDEDAAFCPRCGRKIARKEHKRKIWKMVLILFLCLTVVLCLGIWGISRYHRTEKYIVNTGYKNIAKKFKAGFDVLDSADDVYYIVAECGDVSCVKAVGKWNGDEQVLTGIQEKGKWTNTDTVENDMITEMLNERLAAKVEEQMLINADRIVVYDKEFQMLDTVKLD